MFHFASFTLYEEYKSISLEDTYMVKNFYAWLSDHSFSLTPESAMKLTRSLIIGKLRSHTPSSDMIIYYFCSSSASMRHNHLIYIA